MPFDTVSAIFKKETSSTMHKQRLQVYVKYTINHADKLGRETHISLTIGAELCVLFNEVVNFLVGQSVNALSHRFASGGELLTIQHKLPRVYLNIKNTQKQ